MRVPWYRCWLPGYDDDDTDVEREKRDEAERDYWAEADAREYNEVMDREGAS